MMKNELFPNYRFLFSFFCNDGLNEVVSAHNGLPMGRIAHVPPTLK